MFVSTYTTYISNTNSQNIKKNSYHTSDIKQHGNKHFSTLNNEKKEPFATLPLNYISQYKSLSNQQKLQQENQNSQNTNKYTKISTPILASKAYSENSITFSFSYTSQVALIGQNSTSHGISTHQAINTYISNDNYYRATA
ncbi:hypothetical protein [Sulfurimonas sp.]